MMFKTVNDGGTDMSERRNILVLNPGSTSTKIALYNGSEEVATKNFSHSREEIAACPDWLSQVDIRAKALEQFMAENGLKKEDIDLIVPRYTLGNNVRYPRHYAVNQALIDYIESGANHFHIMSITPLIPYRVFGLDVPMAVVNNDIYLDIDPLLTITGIPEVKRSVTKCHMENMIAVTDKLAHELGKKSADLNLVIAHLGGGVSFSWVSGGKIRYTMFDGEACFSPERGGVLPALPLINMCFSGEYTKEQMVKKIKGAGGLVAYFGTNDALEIENRALAGEQDVKQVYDAMLTRAAACIGECAAVAKGRVDYVVLTGGLARGKYVRDYLEDCVKFIAPVKSFPGEFEMEAFSGFGDQLLSGTVEARPFDPSEMRL